MPSHWAAAMVSELRQVDLEEAPHGLYGLRKARQAGERLPKLPAILAGPSVRLIERIGGVPSIGRPHYDHLTFELEGPRTVWLTMRYYADTKVRKFGNEHRLDKRTQVSHEPLPDLPSEVPKLAEEARKYPKRLYSFGLLFIGHFRKEKDGVALLGRSIHPEFIARYGLQHVSAAWNHVHGRDFTTILSLWSIDLLPKPH